MTMRYLFISTSNALLSIFDKFYLYQVAQITFNLWYRLSEILYQRNSDDLNAVFRPHIERLIGALCRHCQMEPDHVSNQCLSISILFQF